MKLLINICILYNIYNLVQSTPSEEQKKRDFKTLNLVLSRYQHISKLIEPFPYTFFEVNLTKIHFFQPLTTKMTLEQSPTDLHKIIVGNFTLPMLCNLSIQIIDTTLALYEYDFIIEVNFKEAVFTTGLAIGEFMSLDDINLITLTYSKKRNFIVSRRFTDFNKQEDKLNDVIKKSLTNLLKSYLIHTNYLQIDFDEINALVKTKTQINHKITEDIILDYCSYTKIATPYITVIKSNERLEVQEFTISISYVLLIKGEAKHFLFEIVSDVFYSFNDETSFYFPKFINSYKGPEANQINHKLFETNKEKYAQMKKVYYERLFG